jgi:hypothetical protein
MPDAAASEPGHRTATTVVMITGERYEIDGAPGAVEEAIVAASRGSIMQLAWVTETGSGRTIGINPQHVVAVEPS